MVEALRWYGRIRSAVILRLAAALTTKSRFHANLPRGERDRRSQDDAYLVALGLDAHRHAAGAGAAAISDTERRHSGTVLWPGIARARPGRREFVFDHALRSDWTTLPGPALRGISRRNSPMKGRNSSSTGTIL